MAAGKPVIASDEQLLGRLTRERGLGFVFPSGNVPALRDAILRAAQLPAMEAAQLAGAARTYADQYSRRAFRAALIRSLSAA